jgi:molecular chaperone GrpE (heat shock protein)
VGDDGRPAQDEPALDGSAQDEQAPAPTPDPDVLHRVLARLDDLDRRLGAEQERAQAREEVIAHQRAELDALRDERRGRHLRPLVVGLAKLRAELLEDAAADPSADPAAGRHRDTLTYYADSVASVLEGCGCEPVTVAVGDVFDASAHRVRRPVATGPESHGRVVAVLTEGWLERDSGRVLAPAGVAVGRHEPAQNTQSAENAQSAENTQTAENTQDQEVAHHA